MQHNFPTVVVHEEAVPDKVHAHNGSASFIVGLVQVICGSLLAIFLIAGTAIASKDSDDAGIVIFLCITGLIFIASTSILGGAFAIAAGRTKSTCLILTTMVFGVLNALLVAPYVIYAGAWMIKIGEDLEKEEDQSYSMYTADDSNINAGGMMGVGALLLIIGLIQLGVSIAMSVFACSGTCCCKPYPGSVQPSGNMTMGHVAGGNVQVGTPYTTGDYGYDQPKI